MLKNINFIRCVDEILYICNEKCPCIKYLFVMDILNHKLMRMKKFAAFFVLALSLSLQSCEDWVNPFIDSGKIVTDIIYDENSSYWVDEEALVLIKLGNVGIEMFYQGCSLGFYDNFHGGSTDDALGFAFGDFCGNWCTVHQAHSRNEITISVSYVGGNYCLPGHHNHTDEPIIELPPTRVRRIDVEKSPITAGFYAHRGFKEITDNKEAHGVTADGASQLLITLDESFQNATNVTAYVNDAMGKVEKTYFDETLKKWCIVYTAPSLYTWQNAHITVIASLKGEDKVRLYEVPEIKIYKMGVGLIHGLNSNAKDCFGGGKKGDGTGGLYGYLVDEVGYEDCQVKLIDYEKSNKSSFDYNTWINGVIDPQLTELYENLLANGIVSSRYALVGHSMGGILSRLYVQKINKAGVGAIITLDTPHWGSEWGDCGGDVVAKIAKGAVVASETAMAKGWIAKILAAAKSIERMWQSGPLDALRDLATGSRAIAELNGSSMSDLDGIPVHAINSDMEGFVSAEIKDENNKYISSLKNFAKNTSPLMFFMLEVKDFRDKTGKFYEASCSEPVADVMEKFLDGFFKDNMHDAVVSGRSQRGGLDEEHYTVLSAPYKGPLGVLESDAFHCKTNKWRRTYETIADLLDSPYNDPRFCKTGFKAPPADYAKATRGTESAVEEDGYVFATNDSSYIDIKSYAVEDFDEDSDVKVLKIETEASDDVVVNMVLVTFGEEDFNADLCRDTYYMEIPEDYAGDVQICVFGKNTANELVVDVVELVL